MPTLEGWVRKFCGASNWFSSPSYNARYLRLSPEEGVLRYWTYAKDAASGQEPRKCLSLEEVVGIDTNEPQYILFIYFTKGRTLQIKNYTHEDYVCWRDALLPFTDKKMGAAWPGSDDSTLSDAETHASGDSSVLGSRQSSSSSLAD